MTNRMGQPQSCFSPLIPSKIECINKQLLLLVMLIGYVNYMLIGYLNEAI